MFSSPSNGAIGTKVVIVIHNIARFRQTSVTRRTHDNGSLEVVGRPLLVVVRSFCGKWVWRIRAHWKWIGKPRKLSRFSMSTLCGNVPVQSYKLVLIAVEFSSLLVTSYRIIFATSHTWKIEMHVCASFYALSLFLIYSHICHTNVLCYFIESRGDQFLVAEKDYH